MSEFIKDTTVLITCSENPSIFKCIDSARTQAPVVVSMTPSPPIEAKLSQMGIPYVLVPRGNLGLTFNRGIELVQTPKVLITTNDTVLEDGVVAKISDGLDKYDACKARLSFEYKPSQPGTKVVAGLRDSINSSPRRAYTPGLGINKDIKERMGGHFFDEGVRWAEDAEFSHRLQRNGLTFGYIQDAVIHHGPVDVKHDLKGALMIGLSKRRAVDLGLGRGDEDILPTLQRLLTGEAVKRKIDLAQAKGLEVMAYRIVWDAVYNAGYNLRKYGLSDLFEEKLWNGFGRDKQSLRGDN
jgi:hypothetical protein